MHDCHYKNHPVIILQCNDCQVMLQNWNNNLKRHNKIIHLQADITGARQYLWNSKIIRFVQVKPTDNNGLSCTVSHCIFHYIKQCENKDCDEPQIPLDFILVSWRTQCLERLRNFVQTRYHPPERLILLNRTEFSWLTLRTYT